MMVSLYVGMSLDGFIAREDDGLDFLPVPEGGDDLGFADFLSTVDALVMGRRTFQIVQGFGPEAWPYGDTRVVVLSRTAEPATLLAGAPPTVAVRSGAPAALLEALEAEGASHVYVDGGETARSFLAAGLVDRIEIAVVPVLIGKGRRLFGPLGADVRLALRSSRVGPGGLVRSGYEVLR